MVHGALGCLLTTETIFDGAGLNSWINKQLTVVRHVRNPINCKIDFDRKVYLEKEELPLRDDGC